MRLLGAASQAAHTDAVQAKDAHPARIGDAAVEDIGTEREFMDALRVLKARSGLSYRDIAMRMSRVAPRQAMAKSTLAALFAQDALPRRPGQLTAIVDVLAGELAESADLAARYAQYLSALRLRQFLCTVNWSKTGCRCGYGHNLAYPRDQFMLNIIGRPTRHQDVIDLI